MLHFMIFMSIEKIFLLLICVILFFQSMCLQFINALLSETDDFEFRMHLRNEIVRNGLFDKLGKFFKYNKYK